MFPWRSLYRSIARRISRRAGVAALIITLNRILSTMCAKALDTSKKVNEIRAEIKKIARNYGNLKEPTAAETERYQRDIDRQMSKMEHAIDE